MFQYTSIFVTVALTVIAGLSAGDNAVMKEVPWLIPVMSGVAALAATLLAATRAQEQYLYHRKVEVQMEAERALFQQGAGGYKELTDEEKARLLAERIVAIWTTSFDEWQRSIRQSDQRTDSVA